jgi:hypothetical protein
MKVSKVLEAQGGYSVLIVTKGLNVWVDVHIEDKDAVVEWNQYIFHDNDLRDQKVKEFQDNPDNYDIASSLAVQAVEFYGYIRQEDNGDWVEVDN